MSSAPLNKDLPIPLYYQLKMALMKSIESGELQTGEQLPNELQLAGQFGISKITVRQALQGLAELGYIRREHGRGTFVCKLKVDQGPHELTSFSEEMRRRNVSPSSRILTSAIQKADARTSEALSISIGKPIFVLKRLRLADGEPMGVQTAHIPMDMVPGLEKESLENVSLYQVLQSRYNLQPARARETYFAIRATAAAGRLLGVPSGSALFDVERVTLLSNGRPFEFVQSIVRGDRYSIILELVADRAPQAIRQQAFETRTSDIS